MESTNRNIAGLLRRKFTPCILLLGSLLLPGRANSEPFIVNHTNLNLYDQIPAQYFTAASNIRMMWGDRSVGGNINEGLTCLTFPTDELAPNHCSRAHSESAFLSPPSETDWNVPGGRPRDDWVFYFDPGLGVPTELQCPALSGSSSEWIGCFLEHVRNNINSYEVFSYQHSYLAVISGSGITSPTAGYFVDRANASDIFDYERLESEFPTKRFIYWTTSLARGIGTQEATDYNNAMRSFVTTRNKVLFDVADIESHDPWGNPCYDNRDGIPYSVNGTLRENYPSDGLNIPAICQHYTGEHDGGHLSVGIAKIRLAKAYWIIMAYLAGWRPQGGPGPDLTPPSPPENLRLP